MKNQTPRWRKAVYRFVLFPAAVILIAALGCNLFVGGNSNAGSAGALQANIVLATTAAEAKAAAPTFEAAVEAHQATCFVICDGAIGKEQVAQLNTAAAQHADVLFVVMSSERGAQLINLVAQMTGGTVAFPMFVIERKDGARAIKLGYTTAADIEAWVNTALTAKAGEDATTGGTTGDAGITPGTPATAPTAAKRAGTGDSNK